MPVRALWGVGPATAARLERVGVETIGALADVPESSLCHLLGQAAGRHLASLARGQDAQTVEPDRVAKSVGHEETFAKDVAERPELLRHALRMADAVGARLTEAGLWGRTVSVKIRYADRTTITRSHTAAGVLRASHTIAAIAQALVDAVDLPQGVRLIGVSVSGLERADKDVARQLSFATFTEKVGGADAPSDTEDQAWRQVSEAMSAIRSRYGQGSVGPAALVGPDGLEAKKRGESHWGPEA
jgi:DNA polymerase-4